MIIILDDGSLFSKLFGNYRISLSLMLLMIIVHLAQWCLIFQKKSSPLLKIFRQKTSQKIVAYKPLLIKQNECKQKICKDNITHSSFSLQPNKLISFYHYLQSLISQVALSFLNSFKEDFSGCTLQQFELSFFDVGFFSVLHYKILFTFIVAFFIFNSELLRSFHKNLQTENLVCLRLKTE